MCDSTNGARQAPQRHNRSAAASASWGWQGVRPTRALQRNGCQNSNINHGTRCLYTSAFPFRFPFSLSCLHFCLLTRDSSLPHPLSPDFPVSRRFFIVVPACRHERKQPRLLLTRQPATRSVCHESFALLFLPRLRFVPVPYAADQRELPLSLQLCSTGQSRTVFAHSRCRCSALQTPSANHNSRKASTSPLRPNATGAAREGEKIAGPKSSGIARERLGGTFRDWTLALLWPDDIKHLPLNAVGLN